MTISNKHAVYKFGGKNVLTIIIGIGVSGEVWAQDQPTLPVGPQCKTMAFTEQWFGGSLSFAAFIVVLPLVLVLVQYRDIGLHMGFYFKLPGS